MNTNIETVHWIDFHTLNDERGALTAIEELKSIPIEIKRIFYMHQVNSDRGGHAHIDTDQIIIAISGFFSVKLFDGKNEKEYKFSTSTKGLYVPRLIFTTLYDFSPGSVCLVLANTNYDISKSLRDLDSYLFYLNNTKPY